MSGFDADGDPLPSTTAPLVIDGVIVSPRAAAFAANSQEVFDRGRAGVIVGLTLYLPPGTDVVRTDLFEIDGVSYEVEGEPGVWVGHHVGGVEVALRRAEG